MNSSKKLFILCFSFFILLSCTDKKSSNNKSWDQWKENLNRMAKESPTSFLNAVLLEQGRVGEKLYLITNEDKEVIWVNSIEKDNKNNSLIATASHEGSQIRINRRGKSKDILISNKNTRSYEFETKGGKYAKVYHGRKHGKLWAYIFDPRRMKKFSEFKFYPYNEKAYVEAIFEPIKPVVVQHRTFQGDSAKVRKIGFINFNFNGNRYKLSAYNWQNAGEETGFALIFTDNSSGKETYGGGRELSVKVDDPSALQTKKSFKIDFNKTINFSCAHNPFWHCPVGLQENLPILLQAGELLPEKNTSI